MTETLVLIVFLLIVGSIAFFSLHSTCSKIDERSYHAFKKSQETDKKSQEIDRKIEEIIKQILMLKSELNSMKEATPWFNLKDKDES